MKSNNVHYRRKVETKGSKGVIIYIIIPVMIVLGVFVYKFYSDVSTKNNSYEQIEYINSFMRNGQ